MINSNSPTFFYAKCYNEKPPNSNASPLPLYIDRHLSLPSLCEASHNDGFGEGFEQREIKCNGKDVYVSFWGAENWNLKTAEELGITQQNHEMKFGGM